MGKARIITGFGAFCGLCIYLAVLQSCECDNIVRCGPQLSKAMETVCLHGYNSYRMDKRNSDDVNDEIMDNRIDLLSIFKVNNGGLAQVRRRRYGLASECCPKGCTPMELFKYCLPPPSSAR